MVAEATVSDYDYLRVKINQLKSETSVEEEEAAEQPPQQEGEPQKLESFDEIESFFANNPTFVSHCYEGPSSGKSEPEVLRYIPENSFYRKITFQLFPLRFGFDLVANIEMTSDSPFFPSYEQTVSCTANDIGCQSLRVSPKEISMSVSGEDEENITKNEDWVFYLSADGELFGEASFSMSKKERNWIGAPVGTQTTSKSVLCYLESAASDELPLFTSDPK